MGYGDWGNFGQPDTHFLNATRLPDTQTAPRTGSIHDWVPDSMGASAVRHHMVYVLDLRHLTRNPSKA